MLKLLSLTNFKCFDYIQIPMAPMTLLTGVNGMGKSSVIQSLLLLRQSYISGLLQDDGLLLNGPLVSMGAAEDVFYENAPKDGQLCIAVVDDCGTSQWNFEFLKGRATQPLSIAEVNDSIFSEGLFSTDFNYLCAERIGPRTSFSVASHHDLLYCLLGKHGEFCADYLSEYERRKISLLGLSHNKSNNPELREQVESWISEITPGTRIHLTQYPSIDLINMEFSFVSSGLPSRKFRTTNVGFGLTYALPIFVAALSAKKGSMLIIENPEAHLHPKGQALIGRFLAIAASSGVQVVVETHSDHVLNGIRVAIKDKIIDNEHVSINFFTSKTDYNQKIISPSIDSDGRINQWPTDFFDEWEKNLDRLIG